MRRSVASLEPKGLRLIVTHARYSEEMYASIASRFGRERMRQTIEAARPFVEVAGACEGSTGELWFYAPIPIFAVGCTVTVMRLT